MTAAPQYTLEGWLVELMTIGGVARELGVSDSAVRYWERQGLIPAPTRDSYSGRRLYSRESVEQLRQWLADRRAAGIGVRG